MIKPQQSLRSQRPLEGLRNQFSKSSRLANRFRIGQFALPPKSSPAHGSFRRSNRIMRYPLDPRTLPVLQLAADTLIAEGAVTTQSLNT